MDLLSRGEADLVTLVVPEIVPRSWLGHLLRTTKRRCFISHRVSVSAECRCDRRAVSSGVPRDYETW